MSDYEEDTSEDQDQSETPFEDADDVEVSSKLPNKFRNCPSVKVIEPNRYLKIGMMLRLDYVSPLHSDNMDFEIYSHRFSSGVGIFLPDYDHDYDQSRDGDEEDGDDSKQHAEEFREERRKPVAIGFADRVILVSEDGAQAAFARKEIGLSEEDEKDSAIVEELPDSLVLYDPVEKRILIATGDGECLFLLADGLLDVHSDGMIIG